MSRTTSHTLWKCGVDALMASLYLQRGEQALAEKRLELIVESVESELGARAQTTERTTKR